jgi:hypothetical protein
MAGPLIMVPRRGPCGPGRRRSAPDLAAARAGRPMVRAPGRAYAAGMEHEPAEPPPEPDYRHLPPRITPDEMVPVQPVVRTYAEPQAGTDTEWQLRMGGAG